LSKLDAKHHKQNYFITSNLIKKMKKLQKLVLHNHTKMTAPQMKYITGGYGGSSGCDFNTPENRCSGDCSGVNPITGNSFYGKCKYIDVEPHTGCTCDADHNS
jgi:hypothetical protein